MGKLQLVMVVHCHQPIGNFESVCEKAFQSCYQPFLELLEHHPGVRLGLHYSGALLEWTEKAHPDFIERIDELHARGQIELLGGGFYEPILTLLPDIDALGQILKLQDYLEARFGATRRGLWLTERVWEPGLVDLLSRAGVRYTLLDDTLFSYAGVPRDKLSGYYCTERAGRTLAVFPIDKVLRKTIPNRTVTEIIDELKNQADRGVHCITYGDDGEKFGLWPGSYDVAYTQGWLQNFFEACETNADWLETVLPHDYLNRFPSSGRVYLPSSAYEELDTWALPLEAQQSFEELKYALSDAGLTQKAEPFCRGGLFDNFLVKYPEVNHLHKKMLLVSNKLSQALSETQSWTDDHEQARLALYRGQCASAYWHGVSGGTYLPHLRDAAYRELIKAESILDTMSQGEVDWLSFDQRDFDADLVDEVLIESGWLSAYVDPAEGGSLTELDFRSKYINLINVLARRPEAYHHCSEGDVESNKRLDTQSYDQARRVGFLDRFLAVDSNFDDVQQGGYREEGDFLTGSYDIARLEQDTSGQCDCELVLKRRGHLRRNDVNLPLEIEKRFCFFAERAEVAVEYTLRNPALQPLDACFCPELNFTWLAGVGEGERYWIAFSGASPEAAGTAQVGAETDAVTLTDRVDGVTIAVRLEPSAAVWCYPVVTSSNEDTGLTRIQQGLAILARNEITIPPGASVRIAIRISIVNESDAPA